MGISECGGHRESIPTKSNNEHRGTELKRTVTAGTDTVFLRGNTFDSDNAEDFID